jgi:Holliday junction resolvasome RuvABC ATP-dependent DNA helicase subunit
MADAAWQRGDRLDHILLWGPDGVGKANLARLIAREMNGQVRVTTASAIADTRGGDLAAMLGSLRAGDVLVVEGVDTLKRKPTEVLTVAMRNSALDFSVGKGPSERFIRLNLPQFTVIATANEVRRVGRQLLSAFVEVFHLTPHTPEELEPLVRRAADSELIEIDQAAALEIARQSCGLQAEAIRLLKRVRDYAQVRADGIITERVAKEALSTLGIGEPSQGLSEAEGAEGREPIPDWMRRAVLDRDQGICRYCGQRAMTLHLDHVVPVSQGGRSTVANLVTTCAECNLKKAGRTPDEAGMTLLSPGTLAT